VSNLVRLSLLLDCGEYRDKAGRILQLFHQRLSRVPVALPAMVSALIMYEDSPTEVKAYWSLWTSFTFSASSFVVLFLRAPKSAPPHRSRPESMDLLLTALSDRGQLQQSFKSVGVLQLIVKWRATNERDPKTSSFWCEIRRFRWHYSAEPDESESANQIVSGQSIRRILLQFLRTGRTVIRRPMIDCRITERRLVEGHLHPALFHSLPPTPVKSSEIKW
jgi:hypothetical protein